MDRKGILDAAKKCVCGDRDEQYGSPEKSFEVIARFWDAYLESKPFVFDDNERATKRFDAHDVAVMMCLFKIARVLTGANKSDNYIDLAGYAACAGEIADEF